MPLAAFSSLAASLAASAALGLIIRAILQWFKNPLRVVAGPMRASFIYGDLRDLFALDGIEYHEKLVDEYCLVVRTGGLLGTSELIISDPAAIYQIVSTDSYNWPHPSIFIEMNNLIFGPGILSAHGAQHKKQRKVLNPIFTQAHIKDLTPVFYNVTNILCEKITSEIRASGTDTREINVLDWLSRTALELIGQGGIGHSFDALESDKNEYNQVNSCLFYSPTMDAIIPISIFIPLLKRIGSARFQRWAVNAVAPFMGAIGTDVLRFKNIIDVMENTTGDIYTRKKGAIERDEIEDMGQGKDILALLLQKTASAAASDRLTDVEMRAQISTLILAGHETTSGTLARTLHILSMHTGIQNKLRQEVTQARAAQGDLDFEDVSALPYLHDVCREILRLHPPAISMPRTANIDTILPLQFPVKSRDGKTELSQITIPKGSTVHIYMHGMNRSKAIWGEDAREFKPERWQALPETVTSIKIPGVFGSSMAFFAGPRACIGYRFALLELKIVLSMLIATFSFAPGSKEIKWCMGPTTWPTIEGAEEKKTPQLPLQVSLL